MKNGEIRIFGVPMNVLSKTSVCETVMSFLAEPRFHRIVTVNPEFLLRAEQDSAFQKNLLSADLRIVDGFGIVLVGVLRGKCITRFPGADLMEEILRIADEKRLSVYLAVRKDGLSIYTETRRAILRRYPNITLGGTDEDASHLPGANTPSTKYDILLSNFGAPEQEYYVESLRSHPGKIRLAMGVGGAFDFLTGKQKRAPRWLRAIGLEWLFRLVMQPKRIGRIWRATAVFLWKSFVKKEREPQPRRPQDDCSRDI